MLKFHEFPVTCSDFLPKASPRASNLQLPAVLCTAERYLRNPTKKIEFLTIREGAHADSVIGSYSSLTFSRAKDCSITRSVEELREYHGLISPNLTSCNWLQLRCLKCCKSSNNCFNKIDTLLSEMSITLILLLWTVRNFPIFYIGELLKIIVV